MTPTESKSNFVTAYKEDILISLDKIINDMSSEYHEYNQRYLFGFALGPNAYKSFELSFTERQRIPIKMINADSWLYRNYQILASPYAGIIPLFKHDGWYIAQKEAQKWMNKDKLT